MPLYRQEAELQELRIQLKLGLQSLDITRDEPHGVNDTLSFASQPRVLIEEFVHLLQRREAIVACRYQ